MVTSPDYNINVKVVSRYIAVGHDTYREPPYRYCIDISPYRLIPNIEGKFTCHVQEWPRNKLPTMVLVDFTYEIRPEPISVVQTVNVFQNWPLNDPYWMRLVSCLEERF